MSKQNGQKMIYGVDGSPISMVTDKGVFRNANSHPSLKNGFGGGIPGAPPFWINPFGFPQAASLPHSQAISNIDTLSNNLRWYLISNFWQILSQSYAELGLVATIVDVPVDDAFRGGVDITSLELEEEQIKDLTLFMEDEEDLIVAAMAAKWTRLYGGGGVIPIVMDQDPAKELKIDAITDKTKVHMRDFDLWEIFWDTISTDDGYNDINVDYGDTKFENYSFYGQKVHKSRVLKMVGKRAPSFLRPRLRGWGLSVLERLVRSLNQNIKATDLTFEVLDEFKLDIYMLDGLAASLQMDGSEQVIQQRVQHANGRKNYLNATVLDGKDKFEQRELSFSGLGDTAKQIMIQTACDLRMPMTKLWGISAAGFNSGEDDIEVYNGMIESEIRPQCLKPVKTIAKIRCQQLFGYVPKDLEVRFKSLRMLSAVDEETVKTSKHTRVLAARQAGEISTVEYRKACNKGKLHDIAMDVEKDKLDPDDPMVAGIIEKTEDEPLKPTEPGAKPPAGKKPDNQPPKAPDAPDGKKNTLKNLWRKFWAGGVSMDFIINGGDLRRMTTEQLETLGNMVQAAKQLNAKKKKNDEELDVAALIKEYESHGGDNFISREEQHTRMAMEKNGPIWEKAKEVSEAAFGKIKWPFVMWYYQHHGG